MAGWRMLAKPQVESNPSWRRVRGHGVGGEEAISSIFHLPSQLLFGSVKGRLSSCAGFGLLPLGLAGSQPQSLSLSLQFIRWPRLPTHWGR